ncbi:F-box protein VBF-like [Cicer arietinum]|uniref:F-box protein VBF-like n=1 Tax=Cicer arietinum TaxID=3827 RepID=A0A1S2XUA8_CICAR|nr:F-box protein VBF-like [Cicer arietinum]
MNSTTSIFSLPEDCIYAILSHTSPQDACRFSLVSNTFVSVANSNLVWKTFLPSDYEDIVSRVLNPFTFKFISSYKQLFRTLSRPLLLDGGNKSFRLEKCWGKKCYLLSARELSIAWSIDPMFWIWKPIPESRFAEVAELKTVNWLEIEGTIRSQNLTANTLYAAYLVMKVSDGAYGLDSGPSDVTIEMGNKVKRGKAYLCNKDENKCNMETLFYGNRRNRVVQAQEDRGNIHVPAKRLDGWMEIEIGEFFSGESDEEIKMTLTELGYQLKGGLIVEGIEVRPK